MSINKVKMAGWLPGVVAGLLWVLISLGPALAADSRAMHSGQELYDAALLGVKIVDARWLLDFGRPKPAILASNFTMSYCGRELTPTGANLTAMIGKPCRSWSLAVEHKMLVYHRLEFQCR